MAASYSRRKGWEDPELKRNLVMLQKGFLGMATSHQKTPVVEMVRRMLEIMQGSHRYVFSAREESWDYSGWGSTLMWPTDPPVPEAKIRPIFKAARSITGSMLRDVALGGGVTIFEMLIDGMRLSSNKKVKLFHLTLFNVFMTPVVLLHDLGISWSWTESSSRYDYQNAPEVIAKSKKLYASSFRAYKWYLKTLETFEEEWNSQNHSAHMNVGDFFEWLANTGKYKKLLSQMVSMSLRHTSLLILPEGKPKRSPNKKKI